jgi:hypothetical protein
MDNPTYYYNHNIRNMLVGFLDIFTAFKIRRYNSETKAVEKEENVKILFGPIERSSYIYSDQSSAAPT